MYCDCVTTFVSLLINSNQLIFYAVIKFDVTKFDMNFDFDMLSFNFLKVIIINILI